MVLHEYWDSNSVFEPLSTWKWDKLEQRTNKIEQLIRDWFISKEQVELARSLTFTSQNIIDDTVWVKMITELYDMQIIWFNELKKIVKNANHDLTEIRNKIKTDSVFNIRDYPYKTQVAVMSILEIWL